MAKLTLDLSEPDEAALKTYAQMANESLHVIAIKALRAYLRKNSSQMAQDNTSPAPQLLEHATGLAQVVGQYYAEAPTETQSPAPDMAVNPSPPDSKQRRATIKRLRPGFGSIKNVPLTVDDLPVNDAAAWQKAMRRE